MDRQALSSLSREEKLHLFEVIQEKKRRLKERRAAYEPNEGQVVVHRSQKLLRCVFSGNGAGKTAMAVQEALWAAQGYNPSTDTLTPVPAKVAVVLDKPEKVADKWLPEIRKWFNLSPEQEKKNGKPYISQIVFPNGSVIQFFFHEQDQLTFESIEVNFVVFDEPPPRHCYIGLRRGGREKGKKARYLIVGTPLSQAWMRREIYEPWRKGLAPDTECFTFGTTVNEKNLADGYIEEFGATLSAKEKEIRLRGQFFDLDGLALAHLFDRLTHVVPRPEWSNEYPCVVAIDPHPSKAHVAILIGRDKFGLKYLKEISSKCTARQFAGKLKKMMEGYRVVDIVCDCLGNAENTAAEGFLSFIEVLKSERVRVRATTFNDKSEEDWIDRIRDPLLVPEEPNNFGQRLPLLQIVDGCVGIIGDIENVQWVKIKNVDEFKPKLDISNTDYLACLKYALACNLTVGRQKHKAHYRTAAAPAHGQKPVTPGSKRSAVGFRTKRMLSARGARRG